MNDAEQQKHPELPILRTKVHDIIPDIGKAFLEPNDLFDRRELAKKLITLVKRMKDGFVLSIEAGWGEGKSYFATHTARLMEDQGIRVIYINAFKSDFLEDPFLLIASELSKLDEFEKIEAPIGRIVKSGIIAAGKVVSHEVLKKFTGIDILEAKKSVEEELESNKSAAQTLSQNYNEAMDAIIDFQKEFKEAIKGKQIVIFIDELDRCSPTFSVKLLERLKHLFSIQGIVFILMISREAIVSAISGVYSLQERAANEYLNKFINLELKLPKGNGVNLTDKSHVSSYKQYCKIEAKRYTDSPFTEQFAMYFAEFCEYYHLSLRQVETGFANWAIAEPLISAKVKEKRDLDQYWPVILAAWLIALKLYDIDQYKYIRDCNPSTLRLGENIPGTEKKAILFNDITQVMRDQIMGEVTQRLGENVNHIWIYTVSPESSTPEEKEKRQRDFRIVEVLLTSYGCSRRTNLNNTEDIRAELWKFFKRYAEMVDL